MTILNLIFNAKAEAGWPTGKARQLFDNLKQKYNTNNKLSSVQVIKKLVRLSPIREKI